MSNESDVQSHKIMSMEAEKRERLINVAMTEFCKGYKQASTDRIVRDAGISKGLLFHYFGTKKGLLEFLFDFSMEVMISEFYNLIDYSQCDFLERVWQLILIKVDLSYKYPSIFDFLIAVYTVEDKDLTELNAKVDSIYKEVWQESNSKIFEGIDNSLFREDIDIQKSIKIVKWTLTSYSKSLIDRYKDILEYRDSYDIVLQEIKDYIDIFRKTFYK